MKTSLNKTFLVTATVAIALLLVGCQAADPQKTNIVAQPKTPAVKNITNFTSSLRCMDDLFSKYRVQDYIITSAGLPDATGQVQAGTKEMMISAISKMAIKSNSFRFVDYDPTQVGVQDLHDLIGIRQDLGFDIPRFYIRGAITQVDTGVTSDSAGGGFSIPGFAIAANKDQSVSLVSMDMNLGDMITRQILPGIQATNSIAVVRSGRGGDADGKIQKAGLFFQISMDRSEGTHQSVRTLVELSLIETLGKLTKVPYWQCLGIPETNPEMMVEARDWFDSMPLEERVNSVQKGLIHSGYLDQKVPSGVFDIATKEAISRYQAENGLLADARINFDLYYGMLADGLVLGRGKSDSVDKEVQEGDLNISSLTLSPVKFIATTSRGDSPIFKANEKLNIRIEMGDEGAYVYCYYQDGHGSVARIFPNRFSPNAYIFANKIVNIPDNKNGRTFEIRLDKNNSQEKLLCLASRREIGLGLGKEYAVEDLESIHNKNIVDVLERFQGIDSKSLAFKAIDIKVH